MHIDEQVGDNTQDGENSDNIQNAQETTSDIQKPKRLKKQDLQQSLMTDAMDLMKTAVNKLKTPYSDTPEEVKTFGNYIISKMKSYLEETRKGVEHAIFDILIKADTGYYENTTALTHIAPFAHHMPQVYYENSSDTLPSGSSM